MIRYSLRCDQGHEFEAWFRSSQVFDAQKASGLVSCAFCGSTEVDKALMAPALPRRAAAQPGPDAARPAGREQAITEALSRLRAHVEAHSDYVGKDFSTEARAMHEGSRPTRAIHGEARPEEARALIEDGIPVAPLPFLPRQKTN